MITNCLLRYIGYSKEEALEVIAQTRQHTAENVGQNRLDWAEQFIAFVDTLTKDSLGK